MATLTVLGAGYMGSALAALAAERGHDVRLWGTWLDDDLVGPPLRGEPHPRLKLRLPGGVRCFRSVDLPAALAGAEAVVCGVNSDGVLPVFERALPHLPARGPLLSVTKGFLPDGTGRIRRISVRLRELLAPAGKDLAFVAVAGPCKAMEVARGVLTGVVYASEELAVARACAAWLGGPRYLVTPTPDLAGAETCSAFKNAYATASGICDGLQLAGHPEMYNTKALLFAQAIAEIATMTRAMGGRDGTAHGLCGVGDLHVTAAAGRNRTYGERVGRGEPPALVAEEMRRTGELTEGYMALRTGRSLLHQLAAGPDATLAVESFPLLEALHAVVHGGADPASTILGLFAAQQTPCFDPGGGL
jgi:glycerol-3-phosphate dehydrogenase (NAD(P)+)